jgi:hypothetical protein
MSSLLLDSLVKIASTLVADVDKDTLASVCKHFAKMGGRMNPDSESGRGFRDYAILTLK